MILMKIFLHDHPSGQLTTLCHGPAGVVVDGCNMETKEVGVCLHVYLERDFLTMERIVYPKHRVQRRGMLYTRWGAV